MQHTGLGHVDAGQRQAEFVSDGIGAAAVDDLESKGLPGFRLEPGSDRLHKLLHDELVVFAVPRSGQAAARVGELVKMPGEVRAPHRNGAIVARPPEVSQAVDEDGAEPASKSARSLVVLELGELAHDHGEHFLDEIVGIGRLDVISSEPTLQQRRIEFEEPAPRLGVARAANAIQEAQRGLVHLSAH